MNIATDSSLPISVPAKEVAPPVAEKNESQDEFREKFQEFVGKTLFGQLLKSMHSTHDKPAYFHGGRGEEIFQQQLDQILVEEITEASADQIADPMFELFQLNQQR